jgi:signal recognition particle subunit SRP19
MIIYPSNIDSKLSKGEGRKISKKQGVDSPKALEIMKALQVLGESGFKLEKERAYPRKAWEREGRVVLDKKDKKRALLKQVAREIKRIRSSS